MTYFKNCTSREELRAEYRKLALKFHPDRGGDTEVMKSINAEYAKVSEGFTRTAKGAATADSAAAEAAEAAQNLDEYLREKLMNLLAIDKDVTVEIIGSWLWVSHPDSRSIKESLKQEGCRWAPKKKLWYFAGVPSKGRGRQSLGQIRAKYGSQVVKNDSKKRLTK